MCDRDPEANNPNDYHCPFCNVPLERDADDGLLTCPNDDCGFFLDRQTEEELDDEE